MPTPRGGGCGPAGYEGHPARRALPCPGRGPRGIRTPAEQPRQHGLTWPPPVSTPSSCTPRAPRCPPASPRPPCPQAHAARTLNLLGPVLQAGACGRRVAAVPPRSRRPQLRHSARSASNRPGGCRALAPRSHWLAAGSAAPSFARGGQRPAPIGSRRAAPRLHWLAAGSAPL